ncbi:MAG: SufD family Fe-S cluster assembly protein [Ruminococcus sp.]|nr:SufD family Fe-S cluster assembly protein [Ruminococcus sp.]
MENTKLNILPVPTFGSLGVNFVRRDIEEYETNNKLHDIDNNTLIREDITGSSDYKIKVKNNAYAIVVQYVKADSKTLVDTQIKAEAGARLKLVQIFDGSVQTVSRLNATLEDNASLELVLLALGGNDTVCETVAALDGRCSSFKADIGYTLGSGDNLDINLIADHNGRKTDSRILVNGVLDGNASKTFKGTIDFKNGSAGSKGAEQENVLVLDENAVNKTVPVILCAEEDVEGSHGATIGRIDDKQAFYMRSRGFDEQKLYELLARARLKQVIGAIGDRQTESRIYKALDWGDYDEQE